MYLPGWQDVKRVWRFVFRGGQGLSGCAKHVLPASVGLQQLRLLGQGQGLVHWSLERVWRGAADTQGRLGSLEESVPVASSGSQLWRLLRRLLLRSRDLWRRLRGRALVGVVLVFLQFHRLRLVRRRRVDERGVEVVGTVVLVLISE